MASRRYALTRLSEAARARWSALLLDHTPYGRRKALLVARQLVASARAHRLEARPIP